MLITGQCVLKVADFGLAREIYHSVYQPMAVSESACVFASKLLIIIVLQKRVPIKWMAPEGILDGVYTSRSDVYVRAFHM